MTAHSQLPDSHNAPPRALITYLRDVGHLKNVLFALAGGYAVALFMWELAHRAALEDYILTNEIAAQARPSVAILTLAALVALGLWLLGGYLRGRRGGDVATWLDRTSGGLLWLTLLPFLPVLMLDGLPTRRPWLTMGFIAGMALLAGLAAATARWPADGHFLERRTFAGRGPEIGLLIIGVLAALYAVYMSWLTIARHNAFMTHSFDLGIHDQVMYSLLHGGYPRSTQHGAEAINYLGEHFIPIFYLLAPVYALYQDSRMLLLIQSVALGVGAIPVYLLTRRINRNALVALALGGVYLLYPALHGANTFDFHQIVLATPLLLFSLYFLESGRDRAFVVTLLVAMLVKEEVGLTVAAIGAYVFVGKHRFRMGAALAVVGLAYFIIVTKVAMPALGGEPQLNRFEAVMAPGEEGLSAIARTLLTNPFYAITLIFSNPDRLVYLSQLMLPLLFLPLLGGSAWIAAIPAIAVSLLTNAETQFSIAYHYPAIFIPFAFYLAARGARVVLSLRCAERDGPVIAAGPLAAGLIVAGLAMNYSYGWILSQNSLGMALRTERAAAVRDCFSAIPQEASVSAMSDLAPHLSSRREIYLFPIVNEADYIVFDSDSTANFWPFIEQDGRLDAIRELAPYIVSGAYGVTREQDGCLILQRGADVSSNGAGVRVLLTSRHEAEALRSDFPDSVVADPVASGAQARRVDADAPHLDEKNALTYGPYEALFPGTYRAAFFLRHEGAGDQDALATVDIFSNTAGGALAGEEVFTGDVAATGTYIAFPVDVELHEVWPDLEYRILYHGPGDLWADQVQLLPVAAELPVGWFAAEGALDASMVDIRVGNLIPGDYRGDFSLKAAPGAGDDAVATLEVLSGGNVIASRTLSGGDFASPDALQGFAVEFGAGGPFPLTDVTLRVRRDGASVVEVEGVELVYRYHEPG